MSKRSSGFDVGPDGGPEQKAPKLTGISESSPQVADYYVEQNLVGWVLGQRGGSLREVELTHQVKVVIDQTTKNLGYSSVRIAGSKDRIEDSVRHIESSLARMSSRPGPYLKDKPPNVDAPLEGQGELESIKVEQRLVGWIVGKGGSACREIEATSGCKVTINQETKALGFSMVLIRGTPSQRAIARDKVQAAIQRAGAVLPAQRVGIATTTAAPEPDDSAKEEELMQVYLQHAQQQLLPAEMQNQAASPGTQMGSQAPEMLALDMQPHMQMPPQHQQCLQPQWQQYQDNNLHHGDPMLGGHQMPTNSHMPDASYHQQQPQQHLALPPPQQQGGPMNTMPMQPPPAGGGQQMDPAKLQQAMFQLEQLQQQKEPPPANFQQQMGQLPLPPQHMTQQPLQQQQPGMAMPPQLPAQQQLAPAQPMQQQQQQQVPKQPLQQMPSQAHQYPPPPQQPQQQQQPQMSPPQQLSTPQMLPPQSAPQMPRPPMPPQQSMTQQPLPPQMQQTMLEPPATQQLSQQPPPQMQPQQPSPPPPQQQQQQQLLPPPPLQQQQVHPQQQQPPPAFQPMPGGCHGSPSMGLSPLQQQTAPGPGALGAPGGMMMGGDQPPLLAPPAPGMLGPSSQSTVGAQQWGVR